MQRRRGSITPFIAVLTVAMVAVACSPPGPTPDEIAASEAEERRFAGCLGLAEDITSRLQGYVDQFAPDDEELDGTLDAEVPSGEDLRAAADEFRRRRAALGCEAREFQLLLNRNLEGLRGQGSLAQAVAAQVRDQVAPVVGPPAGITVAAGDDLGAAVHDAGPGALIELGPGRHELDEPLVLLRDTRLVGAGTGRTTVASSAPGVVVLQAGTGTLELEGLTLSHEGTDPASVLVVADGSFDLRDVVVRGGLADPDGAAGWGLVISEGSASDDGEGRQRVRDLEAIDNDAGGVVVTGDRAPLLEGVTARDNGGCGVCWVGTAGGSLTGANLTGNLLGLSLGEASAPSITDVVVTGSSEVGVLVESSAGGELSAATITGNGAVGLAVRGGSSITVRDVLSEDHDEAGVLVEGTATPELTDIEVGTASIGLLVRGTAAPTLQDVVVRDVTEAHIVYGEESAGTVSAASCAASVPGIVLLDATDAEVDGGTCEVLDQRGG